MGQLKLILVVFVSVALIEDAKCIFSKCNAKCLDRPPNYCWLPGDCHYTTSTSTVTNGECNSRAVFLEDCPNLSDFKFLPKPAHDSQELGVHPKVCCPRVGVAIEEEKYEVSNF